MDRFLIILAAALVAFSPARVAVAGASSLAEAASVCCPLCSCGDSCPCAADPGGPAEPGPEPMSVEAPGVRWAPVADREIVWPGSAWRSAERARPAAVCRSLCGVRIESLLCRWLT